MTPKFIQRWKARRAVILAAKLVESGYEPALERFPHDPDDLEYLRRTVRTLRQLES